MADSRTCARRRKDVDTGTSQRELPPPEAKALAEWLGRTKGTRFDPNAIELANAIFEYLEVLTSVGVATPA